MDFYESMLQLYKGTKFNNLRLGTGAGAVVVTILGAGVGFGFRGLGDMVGPVPGVMVVTPANEEQLKLRALSFLHVVPNLSATTT